MLSDQPELFGSFALNLWVEADDVPVSGTGQNLQDGSHVAGDAAEHQGQEPNIVG